MASILITWMTQRVKHTTLWPACAVSHSCSWTRRECPLPGSAGRPRHFSQRSTHVDQRQILLVLCRWKWRAKTLQGRKVIAQALLASQLWYCSSVTCIPGSVIKSWQRALNTYIVRAQTDPCNGPLMIASTARHNFVNRKAVTSRSSMTSSHRYSTACSRTESRHRSSMTITITSSHCYPGTLRHHANGTGFHISRRKCSRTLWQQQN